MTYIPPAPATGRPPARRHIGLGAFVAAVTTTAAVALAIAAVPVLLLKPGRPAPTPVPGLVVSQGPLRFVPDPGPGRRATAAEVSQFLRRFYEDVFMNTHQPASATPTPRPADRLARFFTVRARATLRARQDVFASGSGVVVHNGRISFDGLVTMSGRRPAQAFLTVAFTGSGATSRTPVVLTQKGNVLLVHSEQGWVIGGFDLKLDEASVTPSPSPTAR